MNYIKTRKEHPFLSALETNYLQKQGTIFRLDSNQHVLTRTLDFKSNEYTISPQVKLAVRSFVAREGFEPPTYRIWADCSSQLDYLAILLGKKELNQYLQFHANKSWTAASFLFRKRFRLYCCATVTLFPKYYLSSIYEIE